MRKSPNWRARIGAATADGVGVCDHCGCRSFLPIAELTSEHETILSLAWTLSEAVRGGRTIEPTRTDLLDLVTRHITKEEAGLYPALLATDAVSAADVTGLEEDHRELCRSLLEGPFGRLQFLALAAHIEQEELELFPYAMLRFDEVEWNATGEVHRSVDRAQATTVGS